MSEGRMENQLGLYLRDDNLKIIEVENSGSEQFRIAKIIQTKLETPLNYKTLSDVNKLTELGHQLNQIVEGYNLNTQYSIFTLDSPLTLVKKIPYDDELTEQELIDQVDWEVKEFSYSPEDEYIVDFQKLKMTQKRQANEMIIISVRESIIASLKKLFSIAKIKVRVIDLDIFSTIRAIEANYDLRDGEIIALVDINQNGLLFTIIEDKEFYLTQEISLSKLGIETDSLAVSNEEEIAKFISKELRRIILDNKLGENIEDLNRIFLYGDMVKDDVLENLQNNFNVRIDRANPFRRLLFAPNVSVDENIWSRPETFTVCVGSAIRNRV